jgi:hypothetical protein
MLILQGARLALNEAQFSLFAAQAVKGDKLELFEKIYAEKNAEFREIVRDAASMTAKFPKFESFRWRLDCVLSSKWQKNIYQPEYLLKLNLTNGQPLMINSDYANLKHLEYVLEDALKQANSKAAKRIGRI